MFRTLMRSKASGAALTVLLALASFADENGLCYPSTRVIARRARVARQTALDAIKALVAAGELAMIPRGHVDRDRIKDRRRRGGFQATHYYQLKVVQWKDHLAGLTPQHQVVQSTPKSARRSYLLNKSLNQSAPAGGAVSLSEQIFGLYVTVARGEIEKQPDITRERLADAIDAWSKRRGLLKRADVPHREIVTRAVEQALAAECQSPSAGARKEIAS